MQVGFVRQESMKIKQTGEVKKWLECHFRVPGIRPFKAKMTKNKNQEEGKNHPDFIIYHRANVNKGDSFRDVPIGSLWIGSKVIDGVEKSFMTGKVWLGLEEVSVAVWKAEERFEGEVLGYLYDIKLMRENRGNQDDYEDGYYQEQYQQPQANTNFAGGLDPMQQQGMAQGQQTQPPYDMPPEVDIDDDEIPF